MSSDNTSVYELIAQKLGAVPPGFPRTQDGQLEIKLLRWIFDPGEAEIMAGASPIPETAGTIAERLVRPVAEVEAVLADLVSHGCLRRFEIGGQAHYSMSPMIPGVQEAQIWRVDKSLEERQQFSLLWEEYYPTFAKIGSYGPGFARTVPVSEAIDAKSKLHPVDDAHALVDKALAIALVPCVCREEQRLLGTTCTHSSHVCLLLTTIEGLPANAGLPVGKEITKQEAHEVINKCAEEGLIHQTFNADDAPAYFICNCCTCCCVILKATKNFNAPHMTESDFVASIDQQDCSACGQCKEDRCPMDAIEEAAGEYRVVSERCIGCGVCTVTCSSGAIRLSRKAIPNPPPASLTEWAMQRQANRPDKF